MIKVNCSLFGRIRLDLSTGQNLTLKGKKGPALFAYLMVCPNNREQRDTLVQLLWPRSSNDSGRASLRQTMSDLKRQFTAVGLELLQAHPDNIDIVVLNVDQIDNDVLEFNCRSSESGFNAFEAMLHSYSGEFMQGFEIRDVNYMDWLYEQRKNYKERIIQKYKQLVVQNDEKPSLKRIGRMALRVLEIDAVCEQAYQQIMRCELAAGDHAAAIAHYQKCRAVLADSFNVQPSNETEALYQEVITSSNLHSPTDVEPPVSSVKRSISRKSTTLAVVELDYLGDDDNMSALFSEMANELSIALNKFKWISVLNKASTARLKSDMLADKTLSDLEVHYILSGSIRAVGELLIVNVDLATPNASTSVWSERFDSSTDDIIDSFDILLARIACRLDVQLRGIEMRRVITLDAKQLSAPELTLLGIYHLHDMTQSSFDVSYNCFQNAIEQNPAYSPVYSWLSYWEIFYVGQRWANDNYLSGSPTGELTRAAIRHDPEDALALAISGHIHAFLHRNFDAALDHFGHSLILNPYSAFAWMLSSATYSYIGEPDEAIKRLDNAQDLCPIEPHFEYLYSSARCVAYIFSGNYEESIKWGRRSVSDNPAFINGIKQLLVGLGHLQYKAEAETYVEKLLELEPTFCIGEFVKKYPAKHDDDLQRLAAGLRMAGVPEW